MTNLNYLKFTAIELTAASKQLEEATRYCKHLQWKKNHLAEMVKDLRLRCQAAQKRPFTGTYEPTLPKELPGKKPATGNQVLHRQRAEEYLGRPGVQPKTFDELVAALWPELPAELMARTSYKLFSDNLHTRLHSNENSFAKIGAGKNKKFTTWKKFNKMTKEEQGGQQTSLF